MTVDKPLNKRIDRVGIVLHLISFIIKMGTVLSYTQLGRAGVKILKDELQLTVSGKNTSHYHVKGKKRKKVSGDRRLT